MYKVTLKIATQFVNDYKDIVEFDKYYPERLMKAYAVSDLVRVDVFYFNGHKYSSSYGSYLKDDDSITHEEYETAMKAYRAAELAALEDEKKAISLIRKTTDHNYQVTSFYDDMILSFNTYAHNHERTYKRDAGDNYTECFDYFYFDDAQTPMNVYTYLSKLYPNFMYYFDKYELSDEDGNLLVDYLQTRHPM